MYERGDRSATRPASPHVDRRRRQQSGVLPLGERERRIIFQEMIKAEIEAGLLRHSKRRQLLHYATKLGIPQFEASLMIAEVQHQDGQLEPPRLLSAEDIQAKLGEAYQHNAMMRKIVIATAAAMMLDVLVINWFFY